MWRRATIGRPEAHRRMPGQTVTGPPCDAPHPTPRRRGASGPGKKPGSSPLDPSGRYWPANPGTRAGCPQGDLMGGGPSHPNGGARSILHRDVGILRPIEEHPRAEALRVTLRPRRPPLNPHGSAACAPASAKAQHDLYIWRTSAPLSRQRKVDVALLLRAE